MAAAEVDYFERFAYFLAFVVFFNFLAEDGEVLTVVSLLEMVRFYVGFVEIVSRNGLSLTARNGRSHLRRFNLIRLHSQSIKINVKSPIVSLIIINQQKKIEPAVLLPAPPP